MGERGFRVKSDINKEGWEAADFPVVCETCLGDNPYVRMTREVYGKSCKICERPFTNFRHRAGTQGRYKSTQICQTCAKLKNVCQICILDLQYGLPVQVRDAFLSEQDKVVVPQSDANREWFAGQHNAMVATSGGGSGYDKAPRNQTLLRLARNTPYYKRNLPHKCSFYAKGECKRGDKCPFLHEMPTDRNDPLAVQNTRDRFYGTNDPVANKLMGRIDSLPTLEPPADPSITSLWVGNLDDVITQDDLRDAFYHFGELSSIRIIARQRCAFVEFTTREAAERAAADLFNCLFIKGHRLRLTWATRPKDYVPTSSTVTPNLAQTLPPVPKEGEAAAAESAAAAENADEAAAGGRKDGSAPPPPPPLWDGNAPLPQQQQQQQA
eukprot:CAMPEP_0113941608 /NCGR_PEP_ID=MMETSP1339-20121228/7491_1 /TAXON_ID=94617 /ORGANISM="Fibrocapsa japonica" /LENGTH=381 /DNA_ID=CAMNT_0000945801 /DNA_START=29 /DNA_END=1171 /DNA_ORIENTATION=- /assembly_acc=CAM_ASM_000762